MILVEGNEELDGDNPMTLSRKRTDFRLPPSMILRIYKIGWEQKTAYRKKKQRLLKLRNLQNHGRKKLAMPRMGMVADLVEKKVSAKERLHGQEGKEIIRREVLNPAVKPKEIVRQRKSPPITEIIEVVEEEEDEDDIEDESNHI